MELQRRRESFGSSNPSSDGDRSPDCSDERHFEFREGERLWKYELIKLLGAGTFGRVILALDPTTDGVKAIKVVRAIRKYSHEAAVEASILKRIHDRARDRRKEIPIVRLFETFENCGHTCLVFERLGPSLLDVLDVARVPHHMTASSYLSLAQIQTIASSMLEGLNFIHRMALTHTDLKPENVLLCEPLRSDGSLPRTLDVKLIDFGAATFADDHHSEVVCTRQYRAPEVTLGCGWGHAVDLWSTGCILAELYTGRVLFHTHDEAEHLAMMERLLGTLPKHLARSASERAQGRWFKHGFLHWPEIAPNRRSVRHVRETPRLRDALQRDRPWGAAHDDFLALISRLLEYDPAVRITAREALEHPFMTRDLWPVGLS